MAGDWIKVEKSTARKPEIFGIADALQISLDEAFGLCVRFWFWCDDQMTDGHAPRVTTRLLDDAFGRDGFATALLSVGWLQVRSGSLVIPHFDRHLSESAKTRALSANRKAKSRADKSDKSHAECHGHSVTETGPEKRESKSINSFSLSREADDLTFLTAPNNAFERWWNALPAKMQSGRKACWDYWPKAMVDIQMKIKCSEAEAAEHLIQRTELFVQSPRGKTEEFRWAPITFLKDGHYDDSVESWEVLANGSNSGRRRGRSVSERPKNVRETAELNAVFDAAFGQVETAERVAS
ncbi:hypothetical protein [Schlesneria sp.]|uniref:hypothetical protein n=1 Tax=Schlesneria sp. TaxID=2762018 RepID=UPI002F1C5B73